MNIFILDLDAKKAAQYHLDKHVVKMPLETAQMLCTILRNHNIEAPYKSTHKNHPCTLWAGESIYNFNWLVKLGLELCNEYKHRYGKEHKCREVIIYCRDNKPNLPRVMTDFAMAMPDEFKTFSVVESYRNYYQFGKSHLLKYTNRETPNWLN
jgi:hypothetical protein